MRDHFLIGEEGAAEQKFAALGTGKLLKQPLLCHGLAPQ
jgi:hypothetical protein